MVSPAGIRLRTAALAPWELRTLWWAAPPLAVFGLAHLLFELVGGAYAAIGLAEARLGPMPVAVEAVRAGFGWATGALVYLTVGVGVGVAAVRIVRHHVQGPAARPFHVLALVISAVGLVHLAGVDALDLPLGGIFRITMTSLEHADLFEPWRQWGIGAVVAGINVLSVIVPALIVTAAAVSALPPLDGWSEASLMRRARQVRQVVTLAAAFMVAGVLHMGAWTHWAGALAGGQGLDVLATTVTLFWGAAFTLMIASFYLPVAAVLRRLAEAEMYRQEIAADQRAGWLQARDLSFTWNQQLPQLAAMAAPLLAGPLSEAIRASVGQLGL